MVTAATSGAGQGLTVGVLALQGDFREHLASLRAGLEVSQPLTASLTAPVNERTGGCMARPALLLRCAHSGVGVPSV